MRLKILLKSVDYSPLSINYNYALSAAIYKLLQLGSPDFSKFLHETGFQLNGKSYKLFTFALRLQDYSIDGNKLNFISPYASLYISSPLIEDFVKNIVIGAFINQKIELFSDFLKTNFLIHQVELLPEPEFNSVSYFNPISPIVLSTKKIFKGIPSQHFFRYDDDINEINRVLNINLTNKYKLLHQHLYQDSGVHLSWDDKFILNNKHNKNRFSKKTTIIKSLANPIHIKGITVPFSLSGDPKLIKIGYQTGFGEKNSMGFGLADSISK
ncbi:MAG: CRISPR-associated endoribonuclease Cas6 [Bacteroidetes bacterium]|nr:CRISPR-associated endoribonuclease Cas6 [Bacteroidota bacterium]